VHRAPWPTASDLAGIAKERDSTATLQVATDVLGEIRRAKSEARLPLKAPVARAVVRDTPERLERLRPAASDLQAAAYIEALTLDAADAFSVSVEFAKPEPAVSEPGA
jgi:valyl-tRNA synthetase